MIFTFDNNEQLLNESLINYDDHNGIKFVIDVKPSKTHGYDGKTSYMEVYRKGANRSSLEPLRIPFEGESKYKINYITHDVDVPDNKREPIFTPAEAKAFQEIMQSPSKSNPNITNYQYALNTFNKIIYQKTDVKVEPENIPDYSYLPTAKHKTKTR